MVIQVHDRTDTNVFAVSARTAKVVPALALLAQIHLAVSKHCSGENSMIPIFLHRYFALCSYSVLLDMLP